MNKFMEVALNEAKIAKENGEVPVGAAVFLNGECVASAHNKTEELQDATLHAEVLAMKKALIKLNSKYLTDCELFVTLEPCAMCFGAASLLKIKKIYFGAYDFKSGALGGRADLIREGLFDYKAEVFGGIMQNECEKLLKDFFCDVRKGKRDEK